MYAEIEMHRCSTPLGVIISTEGIPVNRLLGPICRVPLLRKKGARNLKDYQIRQSSNVNLFGAQRIKKTAKSLQFLELMKTTFDCSGNTRQRSAGVRRHERNSLDPRRDDFLKLMMQSSRSFVRDAKQNCW